MTLHDVMTTFQQPDAVTSRIKCQSIRLVLCVTARFPINLIKISFSSCGHVFAQSCPRHFFIKHLDSV